ncbi:MAG: hypothetical protein HeimC2_06810 [Candidatus Heimdallarchaeota archaeon LC_2]|nr:MAG: hypothetical protein HeimC2_06810 [Candidatus Heimdallarchaeota archaeon LC_2]
MIDDLSIENYEFKYGNEIGNCVTEHNGATRINTLNESKLRNSGEKLTKILKQMSREFGIKVSHGLKLDNKSRTSYITHFVMELSHNKKLGLFVYDQKRHLSVKQVQKAEKSILSMDLQGGMIIANKIGTPARREIERINGFYKNPILSSEYMDSVTKRYNMNYIQ